MRHEIQALLRQRAIEELISNRHSITMASRKEWLCILFISWMQLYARRHRTSTPEGPRRCTAPWYSWLVKHNRKGLPWRVQGSTASPRNCTRPYARVSVSGANGLFRYCGTGPGVNLFVIYTWEQESVFFSPFLKEKLDLQKLKFIFHLNSIFYI